MKDEVKDEVNEEVKYEEEVKDEVKCNIDNALYYYNIDITKIYDGDTVTANIHLGFGCMLLKQKIRLFGINTPEIRGNERIQGLLVKEKLIEFVSGKNITLQSIKDTKGKYGRWLGILYADNENINEWLVLNDMAKRVVY